MDFPVLRDLVILFGIAVATVVMFKRLNLPSLIGFLAAGIMAGPRALGFIEETHHVEQLAEVGVVLLLFSIGIEFSLGELMRIRHLVLIGGGLQVTATILLVAGVGKIAGFAFGQSVFFGFLVALSSTAILMKLLMDSGELDTPHGKTALGILIFQDLCVVPLMLITPFLAGNGGGLAELATVLGKAAAVVIIAHFSARIIIPWIFRQVVRTRSRELFILTVIFIGFGTAWVTSTVGLSLALGAFIAGLAISESEYSHQVLGDIIPFRDAFLSLFFISVGMLLDPLVFLKHPLLIVGLVAAIIAIKTLVTAGTVLAIGVPMRVAISAALILSQIGEFSFVLSHAGQQAGLLSPELYQIFLVASVATMALTPFLRRGAAPAASWLTGLLPISLTRGRGVLAVEQENERLSGHVVIIGFGLNGQNLSRVLKHLEIGHLIIETNPFTVSVERARGEMIIFGDASREEVLSHASIETARIMVIAISDAAASRLIAALARRMNPRLHIIVRTRYLAEMEPLYQLGANEVIPEEFETSVEIFSRVLKKFLVPEDRIEQCIAEVRRDSYEMFRSISSRHSHAVGISGFLSGAEIATFRVQEGSPVAGTSLREGVLRGRSGVSLLVIRRGSTVVTNPDPVWELMPEDIVLLLGTPEQLAVASRLFEPSGGISSEPAR